MTMFSTILKKATIAPALAVFAGGLTAVPQVNAADLQGPTTVIIVTAVTDDAAAQVQATDLLKQIRSSAAALSTEGSQLESMMNSNVSRTSYADSLTRIKEQINKTGEQLAQFEEIRNDAAPWQQAAVDRITPIAQQLAANTEAAINHINDAPNQLYSATYKDKLMAIAEDSRQMRENVSDFLDLAKAQQRADDLRMKILSSDS